MNIEITIRDLKHLDILSQKLTSLSPSQVNLTDKTGLIPNLECVELIQSILPTSRIVPHYSFKNHTRKSVDEITNNFIEHITLASELGISELLLVSGSPRPHIDSIKGIELTNKIIEDYELAEIDISVAFNPFLEGELLEEEHRRLHQKLSYPQVKKVYLQMGTKTSSLVKGVEFIKNLRPDVEIYSSIIIPDNTFLTKFKYRPWRGVQIDEKYLSNLKNAQQKTQELIQLSSSLAIAVLYEFVTLQSTDVAEFKTLYLPQL